MNPERKDFLNLRCPPGRITVDEAAYMLGCEPDHIFILLSAKLLKPLGDPPPGAMKYFMWTDIEEKKNDKRWMTRASELVRTTIKDKNERAAQNRKLNGDAPKTDKQTVTNGNGRA